MFEVAFAGRVIHEFGWKQHKAGWLVVGGEAANAPLFVRTSDGAHEVVGLVEPYCPHCHLQCIQVKVKSQNNENCFFHLADATSTSSLILIYSPNLDCHTIWQ